jgi:hypothetical protein
LILDEAVDVECGDDELQGKGVETGVYRATIYLEYRRGGRRRLP